ncbi:hypothetical protein L9F63_025445, partial [Diploptera punctata]
TTYSKHLVYLLIYQPGELLKYVSCTNDTFWKIGKFVAEVDEIFKGIHHPAYESSYRTLWSLINISQQKECLSLIKDKVNRNLLSDVINSFEMKVIPIIESLQKGLIHNDFNEQNVIMSQTDDGSWAVSALIDFGDLHRSCYVFELAINIAHVILLSSDPITAAGHIIGGYSRVRPLQEVEFNILKECVCLRLSQLILLPMSAYQINPGNEYLMSWINAGAWDVLRLLWNIPRDELKDKWTKISLSYDIQ